MGCKHPAIRCTDNRFFCLICGAEIDPPEPREDKSKETEKPKRQRKVKNDG